jgi:NAD+ kinase
MSRASSESTKIAFTASPKPEAQAAANRLRLRYGEVPEDSADVIVAVGGDGHMLDVLRQRLNDRKPVYGLNQGTIGFLMNDWAEDGLLERLESAEPIVIKPLRMRARTLTGLSEERLAINEVSLLRQSVQTAKLRITIDGKERLAELNCDGAILATPAGSTAYNLSAQGPILPLGANLLALTPLSPFRPRRWRGALVPNRAKVRIEALDPERRPVAAAADSQEVRDIVTVDIEEDSSRKLTMLFDEGRALDERIAVEQFAV